MSQHARAVRPRRALRAVGLTVVGVLVFGAAAAAAVYRELQSNVSGVDLAGLVGDESARPQASEPPPGDARAGAPVNLLIIGSDDRSGENATIGGAEEGMQSDTTIVAHVAADRSRVELVSIPRDLLADRPSCTMTDGSTTPARENVQFNGAFRIGWDHGHDIGSAAACTYKTVEQLTGVRLDGLVLVDFVGLRDMVNAIGGVPICLPTDLDDPKYTGLHVKAGPQVFDGTTAVQFARARHNIGDGSDTGRMERQQDLMAAMTRSVLSREVLTDPTALFQFAQAATGAITASDGFRNLTDLTGFGLSLRNLTADQIVFVSMPTVPSTSQKYRVEATSEAVELWARVAADQPIGGAATTTTPPVTDPSAPPPTTDAPWTPPADVLTSADDSSTC
ncbi:LCP family protein [Cellulomonas sp. Leaf334]|uniref:LCP family protein n=1 Tax=Cellulomonas sp. Leaf334 TaxID=1736339 RepID=UPI0006F52193|nr:LCP family protein [Cellulomonas sp. Leaf334]KQR12166.1 hypothetical protein ASF78_13500 [Cellulomonas sp. Leaf334]